MKKLLLVLCLVLTTVLFVPSVASASTPTLKSLAKAVAALQKKVNAQATTIASQNATISALQTTVAGHTTTLASAAPLLAIAPYVSLNAGAINGVKGPNIVFTGANVQIKSATSESDTTGLGNLIVGWDDDAASAPVGYRSGSNNLICGDWSGFTSYGGFVAGFNNAVSSTYASVGGGSANIASGHEASVSGGWGNVASGNFASVSGGGLGTASGFSASISGGHGITASTTDAWGHP